MRTSRLVAIAITLLPMMRMAAACSSFSGDEDTTPLPEAGGGDAPSDAPGNDAASDVGLDGELPKTSFTELGNWSVTLVPGVTNTAFMTNGAYDGFKYIYFPAGAGFIARLDTSADFTSSAAWATHDVKGLPGSPRTLNSGVFGNDARVYFPASFNTSDALQQTSVQLDTATPFESDGAWSSFSTRSMVDGGYAPFGGAINANGKVTFLPYDTFIQPDGGPPENAQTAVISIPPNAPFPSVSSWAVSTTLYGNDPTERRFAGAAVIGDYVYSASLGTSEVMRLKTDLSAVPERASTLAVHPVGSNGTAAYGAISDGRYVYFPPFFALPGTSGFSGNFVRYDTKGDWNAVTSFEQFDLTTIDKALSGFSSGTFDGRFVYLVGYLNGKIVRFDTTSSAFTSASSFEVFDLKSISSVTPGFSHTGATFDGQYVYITSGFSTELYRFKARDVRGAWPKQASTF